MMGAITTVRQVAVFDTDYNTLVIAITDIGRKVVHVEPKGWANVLIFPLALVSSCLAENPRHTFPSHPRPPQRGQATALRKKDKGSMGLHRW